MTKIDLSTVEKLGTVKILMLYRDNKISINLNKNIKSQHCIKHINI